MCGDMGFWAKVGLMVTAWATARRTIWVAPKRVRRSLRAPMNIGRGSWFATTATAAEEEVVPASEYRALQAQVKELQRLLGKKTMESEILKEALEIAGSPKKHLLRSLSLPRGILG